MNETMETKMVEEVVDKKERKLPDPICYHEKSGGGIVMIAHTATSYRKLYFENYDTIYNKNESARREKHVNLPVSIDGQYISDVWALFKYLKDNKRYQNTPQSNIVI